MNDINDFQIYNKLKEIISLKKTIINSCLDIGCGINPTLNWFKKVFNSTNFLCVEPDLEIFKRLKDLNIKCIKDLNETNELFDLVIAKEVFEHINKEDCISFLKKCKKQTNKIFAMTVPNFENWNENLKSVDIELRFVPDHFSFFKPTSQNFHDHKLYLTPEILENYLKQVFNDEWDIQIFRAWPWEIKDMARIRKFNLYFKIFAIIIKKD